MHQFELLPGFGKSYTKAIIEEREKTPFTSFEDIKQRLKNIPDPKKVIRKRIIEELTEDVRFKLFTG
jgi:putative nucleotide binding protein